MIVKESWVAELGYSVDELRSLINKDRAVAREVAKILLGSMNEMLIDEIVKLSMLESISCLDSGDYDYKKLDKALRRVHNYFSIEEERI